MAVLRQDNYFEIPTKVPEKPPITLSLMNRRGDLKRHSTVKIVS